MGSGKHLNSVIANIQRRSKNVPWSDVFVLQSKKKKDACVCDGMGLGNSDLSAIISWVAPFRIWWRETCPSRCSCSFQRWRHILHVSQRRGTLTAEDVRQQISYVNALQAVCLLKKQYSWSVWTSDIFVFVPSSVEQRSKSVYRSEYMSFGAIIRFYWPVKVLYVTLSFGSAWMSLLKRHQTSPAYLFYQFWVLGLLLEFSQAEQIQCFFFYLGGHGSVICQTKCFLRLAMCTHQVSVACKSHFTKCWKTFHCNGRGGGENICHRGYTAKHFLHLAELQRDSCSPQIRNKQENKCDQNTPFCIPVWKSQRISKVRELLG